MYPFIFIKLAEASSTLIAHELKHVEQIQREGVLKYYLKYLWFYFQNLRRYRNHHQAYWNIPYEIEARAAEKIT